MSYRNPKMFSRMVKAEALIPRLPMAHRTPNPNSLIASLTQVNNLWDPAVLDDVSSYPTMPTHMPSNDSIKQAMKVRSCKSPGIDGVPPYLWYILPDNIFNDG